MEIRDSTLLVTGGGSGLGEAAARLLAEAGAKIVVADVDADAGARVAGALGGQARFVETDVRDAAAVQRAVDTALEAYGRLSGVVNCAGIALFQRTYSKAGPHRLDAFEQVLAVNLTGTFNVARVAAAAMARNEPGESGERGVIINTASVAAFEGQAGQAAYAASKGGVVGLTMPLARDLAPYGIRVVTVAPGPFDTPMVAALPQGARESLADQVPFPKRLGRPAEFAALVKHIIENPMLNGETIRLDGALRMGPR